MKRLCVYVESVFFNYETFHIKKTWGWGEWGNLTNHEKRLFLLHRLKLVGF